MSKSIEHVPWSYHQGLLGGDAGDCINGIENQFLAIVMGVKQPYKHGLQPSEQKVGKVNAVSSQAR